MGLFERNGDWGKEVVMLKRNLKIGFFILLCGSLLFSSQYQPDERSENLQLVKNAPRIVKAAIKTTGVFYDDFETGTDNWDLDSGWSLVDEGGNTVLEGLNHTWAVVNNGQYWTDYSFETKVKMITGSVHLIFRLDDDHGRYIAGLHPGGIYLRREAPWENISGDLATASYSFTPNTWYTIRIDLEVNRIRISVNGSQQIDFTDPVLLNQWPLWQGTIALEVLNASQTRFDDVNVTYIANPEKSWVRTGGPIGGLGYDVRFSPTDDQVMYVTDNFSGVFKSIDGGTNWFPTNRGIVGRFWPSGDAIPVFTLNVDPNSANNLWAGLKDVKGAYKSINRGQTWQEVTPAMTDPQFVFRGFTVMPGNPNEVFASGELPTAFTGKEFGLVKGRIYHTIDGGLNWSMIREDENLFRYVIVHPENPNVIYASLGIFDREANDSDCVNIPPVAGKQGTGGVLKGVFTGDTWDWTFMNNGLTDMYVGSLVMHPTDPNILLAGAGNVACSRFIQESQIIETGGVFYTDDGGENWRQTLANDIITSVEFSPSDPNIAYAGGQNKFYISTNAGQDWVLVAGEQFPWGPPGILAGFPIDILVDNEDPQTLFVNNYGGGNVKSSDGGVTWSLASKGYTGAMMFDISVHPQTAGTVFAVARSGAFRSFDGGKNWEGMAYPPARFAATYSIAVSPHTPQILLVADELNGELHRSLDGGDSWEKVYQLIDLSGLNMRGFKRIEFAPSAPHIVYAGSCRSSGELHNGKTDSLGVFVSTGTGSSSSWIAANDYQTADVCVNNLVVHPLNHNIVYIASAAEYIYKTTDGGVNWVQKTVGLPTSDIRSLAMDPNNLNILYAGTKGYGVYKSINGGDTWAALNDGMEPNDSIWALEIDPTNSAVIYAGSFFSGVYYWDTTENLWAHLNDGLRTRSVSDLSISNDGSVLYASTWGEGVFRLGDLPSWSINLPLIIR